MQSLMFTQEVPTPLIEEKNKFLEFLDKCFIPEIDLKTHSETFEPIKLPKEKFEIHKINPKNIRTNCRNKPFKANYAERSDVIYKTLLRSLRRYLWEELKVRDHLIFYLCFYTNIF